jgi:lipoprotein-anchoring transpeptidase ErfK/SrfK
MRLRHLFLLCAFPLLLAGCTYEDATDEAETSSAEGTAAQDDISVPDAGEIRYEAARLAELRRDASWRAAAERDRAARRPGAGAAQEPLTTAGPADMAAEPDPALITGQEPPPPTGAEGGGAPGAQPPLRAPAGAESFAQISPDTLNLQPRLPVARDGGGPTALRAQILLDRARFSPGVIDGEWGQNTEKAVFWFQHANGLNATGEVDQATWNALAQAGGSSEPLRRVTLTEQDLRGPFTELPDDVYARAKLDCLCYENALEMLAERGHTTPELLRQLNPQADFDRLTAGDVVWLPNVAEVAIQKGPQPAANQLPAAAAPAELIISKTGFYLQGLDAQGNILFHFPSTLGSKYDPSPDGEYKITGIFPEPDFHYQPKLLADVPDNEENAQLPPGPNSPVGMVWMQLSKPHNGIHGTAVPETIGYASSHGCVRLTNWDAVFLSGLVRPGVPVRFVE